MEPIGDATKKLLQETLAKKSVSGVLPPEPYNPPYDSPIEDLFIIASLPCFEQPARLVGVFLRN
jgi:hypothetical protein